MQTTALVSLLFLLSAATAYGRQIPHSDEVDLPLPHPKSDVPSHIPNQKPVVPLNSIQHGRPIPANQPHPQNPYTKLAKSKTETMLEDLERKGAFSSRKHDPPRRAKRNAVPVEDPIRTDDLRGILESNPTAPPGVHDPAAPPSGIHDALRDHIAGQIIDGIVSPQSRWKWSVELHTEEYGFICGGAIIAPKWVITAAHCVFGAPVTIHARIGSWNLSAADYIDSVPVIEIIEHPLYAQHRISPYDIALLRLIREANINQTYDDILSLPDPLFNIFELNPYCYIIGWGVYELGSNYVSSVLREQWVNVISNTECLSRWDSAFNTPDILTTNICIDENTGSACHGDSGSPLMCYDVTDMRWKLAGLSSFGSMDCNHFPSVYTRVASFRNWILATIKPSLH